MHKTFTIASDAEREYFDSLVCESGESWWGHKTTAGKYRLARRAQIVATRLPLGSDYSVLEIGMGAGALTRSILKLSPTAKLTGSDVSPLSVTQAKERIGKFPNVTFEVQDATDLTYDNCCFDAAIGNSILHHLSPATCLAELFRIIRPGGLLLFFEPNQLNPQVAFEKTIGRMLMAGTLQVSPTERTYTRWTYARFLREAGFTSIEVEPFDFVHPLTPRLLIRAVTAAGWILEHTPLLHQISGSLLLAARRPS